MIFSGQLTERLKFYHLVETQTESGYKHTDEVFYWECRANRKRNKENYAVDAEELFHLTEKTFQMRYNKEIKETDIVVYKGERYRITSINEFPRDREMTIMLDKINE